MAALLGGHLVLQNMRSLDGRVGPGHDGWIEPPLYKYSLTSSQTYVPIPLASSRGDGSRAVAVRERGAVPETVSQTGLIQPGAARHPGLAAGRPFPSMDRNMQRPEHVLKADDGLQSATRYRGRGLPREPHHPVFYRS